MDTVEQQRKQLIANIQTLPADILQQLRAAAICQKESLSEVESSSAEETKSTYERLKDSGLADASLVILAERLGDGRILSTDQRDFDTYSMEKSRAFREFDVCGVGVARSPHPHPQPTPQNQSLPCGGL